MVSSRTIPTGSDLTLSSGNRPTGSGRSPVDAGRWLFGDRCRWPVVDWTRAARQPRSMTRGRPSSSEIALSRSLTATPLSREIGRPAEPGDPGLDPPHPSPDRVQRDLDLAWSTAAQTVSFRSSEPGRIAPAGRLSRHSSPKSDVWRLSHFAISATISLASKRACFLRLSRSAVGCPGGGHGGQ